MPKSLNQKRFSAPSVVGLGLYSSQAGAAPIRSTVFKRCLSIKCHNYWIDREGPFDWSTLFLDFTSSNFFCG